MRKCPTGYYLDNSTNASEWECKRCNESCYECSGPNSDDCTNCRGWNYDETKHSWLNNSECIYNCTPLYAGGSSEAKCVSSCSRGLFKNDYNPENYYYC